MSSRESKSHRMHKEGEDTFSSSHSSTSSRSSSASLVVTKAKAKAEAAKARAAHAKKEIGIKVEQARLQATLEALQEEKERDAAIAEAETLAAAFTEVDHVSASEFPKENSVQRTEDYVRQQACSYNPQSNLEHMSDTYSLAKYLARSHLVTSGLNTFDDKPINYWAWRSSFKSSIADLDLKPEEEMDLLIKYLGRESSEQVRRIKSVNIRHPFEGLQMAWERLEDLYGSPEAIERALFFKLENFPKISGKDLYRLRDLGDLLAELEAAKLDGYLPGLSYLDTAHGVSPIVGKLPYNIQEKWISYGSKYKRENSVAFPPFSVFADFIRLEAKTRTDPSFTIFPLVPQDRRDRPDKYRYTSIAVHKTQVKMPETRDATYRIKSVDPHRYCIIHDKPHPLKRCRGFRSKSLEDRKQFLKEHSICFRCCSSVDHMAKNCKAEIHCSECDSDRHVSALHPGPAPWKKTIPPVLEDGGEERELTNQEVTSKCTEVCGAGMSARACSKICLVNVYPEGNKAQSRKMYAILDEQSNRSLARTEFFEDFQIKGSSFPYSLKTCAGLKETTGRRASGYIVESLDKSVSLRLPTLLECNQIPNVRSEIPTSDAAHHFSHLRDIADEIPALDPDANILLLIGRDLIRVHKVRHQINGPHDAPFAQKLDLGWVVVGDVCLGGAHRPAHVDVFKTTILESGRPSFFWPCESQLHVKEQYSTKLQSQDYLASKGVSALATCASEKLGQSIFVNTSRDHKLALSVDDDRFLRIMDKEFYQDESNSWVAPLPFQVPRRRLPNNKEYAYNRLSSLRRTLDKRPQMKEHFLEFMENMFANGHAEIALPLKKDQECWYLPLFGVYHPKKPNKIRVVFDSSAPYDGVSLNDVLLKGPDLNNSLLGVLLRFRREPVAITADIQHMFHCFLVREDHRDFLRFLWYQDNDPGKEIVEYRMCVHVFGNRPSPAVAIYGLHRTAKEEEKNFENEVNVFVEHDFYVDDALKSFPTEAAAINVLKQTQDMLAVANLRLHKIISNRPAVIDAFHPEDRAVDVKDVDLFFEDTPVQRSLGVSWNLASDTFTFQAIDDKKPFTRRGVLSTVNSLYDPCGFIAPVTIKGRLLLRELSMQAEDWDSPLPDELKPDWIRWRDSLQNLQDLKIPRTYSSFPTSEVQTRELFIFADASMRAVAAVAYLRSTSHNGRTDIGFVFGKTKLAPQPDLTVPRLELCAAVLAVEIADMVVEEIGLKFSNIQFYTDSKVILGYIHNQTKRFYVYVSNRIQRILQSSTPSQWNYVPSDVNPADHGSRSVAAEHLHSTTWLTGPDFLLNSSTLNSLSQENYDLVDLALDPEIRPQVVLCLTAVSNQFLTSERFERFSSLSKLIRAIARLSHISQSFSHVTKQSRCSGWHFCSNSPTNEELEKARIVILKSVQHAAYSEELSDIKAGCNLSASSTIRKLHPILDDKGLLRVGGRIAQAGFEKEECNPVIIPGKHHVATLLVRHYHQAVKHQGRHFTEGAIRAAGYWLTSAKRCIGSLLIKCVTCRKLRRPTELQQMADLPAERLQVAPPFTYVGVDVFGPWQVISRRTRGGCSDSKRWAVIFSCMCTRAVHIEVVETLSASGFINALRRFFAIRGPVKQIRSDCGTNFIGAVRELKMNKETSSSDLEKYLQQNDCTWIFNPPHASHMGGAWERMVGIARRILDCMLLETKSLHLTHEVLVTLMAEVSAIINARPLIPVSSDPEAPLILTPAILLTQKTCSSPPPPGEFTDKDLFKAEWKRVQNLAETFWSRWRREYLSTLQSRQKWQDKKPCLKEGDIVLMKDAQAKRNQWPLAIIAKTLPSKDGLVRKVELKFIREGIQKTFIRPISEVVLLYSP
ncbi:uncharacterized protein [Misgurnus anguillicaudatus]|uniref:uncharacterized protein n=1 Tax=Misgurnus anguillicaudatus TaxID=75329 RepID=UPI003CCF6A12